MTNYIKKRIYSFKYAINGIKIMLLNEPNSIIHLIATMVVVVLGFYYNVSTTEWIILIFAIVLVFSMELVNSAIEGIADFISPAFDDRIKKIKDMAAAAVFISAIASLIIGFLIFIPYVF